MLLKNEKHTCKSSTSTLDFRSSWGHFSLWLSQKSFAADGSAVQQTLTCDGRVVICKAGNPGLTDLHRGCLKMEAVEAVKAVNELAHVEAVLEASLILANLQGFGWKIEAD